MKKTFVFGMITIMSAALCLGACGTPEKAPTPPTPAEEEAAAPDITEPVEEESEPQEAPAEEYSYGIFPNAFTFASGAGGWSTDIILNEDGTFSGGYHDSDMGDNGDGYPNGVLYYCEFDGRFGALEKIDDYTYRAELEELNVTTPTGTVEIKDDFKYCYSDPYGFDDAGTFEFYLPGKPLSEIEEDCLVWTWMMQQSEDVLDPTVMYNVGGKEAFMGYDFEPYESTDQDGADAEVTEAPSNEGLGVDQPFYGIWCYGSTDPEGANSYLEKMLGEGLDARIYITTDWENLNADPYYVITAGVYATEEEANGMLATVQSAGEAEAYVKYSGARK